MKDDDFKLLGGFADRRTHEQTFVIVEFIQICKEFLLEVWGGRGGR